jgi:hypothetical protein
MDRLVFTKSIDVPLFEGVLQENYPEMMAIYNMIDIDKYKVKGHLLENNKLSFTVYCNKDDAVCISNRVQNHVMELYGTRLSVAYSIHKEGIDLYLN